MPFIEKRYDKYQKWKLQFWSSNKQELTEEKFDDVYHIEVFDALECITWASEIIKRLNLLY